MPQEIRLWKKVNKEKLAEITTSKPDFEAELESWLEQDISMVSNDLLVIGRQIGIALGKSIDLL